MASVAVGLDERAHAVAFKAVVNPAIDPSQLFDLDEVPGANWNQGEPQSAQGLLPMWMQLALEQRAGDGQRLVGTTQRTGWRASFVAVATTVDEARWLLWRSKQVLHQCRIAVDDAVSTHLVLESETSPVWNDGRYSGDVVFTYVL